MNNPSIQLHQNVDTAMRVVTLYVPVTNYEIRAFAKHNDLQLFNLDIHIQNRDSVYCTIPVSRGVVPHPFTLIGSICEACGLKVHNFGGFNV